MHRFFADKSLINDGSVHISGEDVAHITKVLRLKAGDEVIVCDGQKTDYLCKVSQTDKNLVTLEVCSQSENNAESLISITLYQGVPKSDKMDFIIQKAVELGVCKIVPVESSRCVAKIKDGDKKTLRWQKIAEEAAKQCGRGIIPEIGKPCSFAEAVAADGFDLKIIPYECEKDGSLKSVLKGVPKRADIAVYIGPEGGFEKSEIETAVSKGAVPVTLGKRILRCETAGIAAVSAVMFELGQWDI